MIKSVYLKKLRFSKRKPKIHVIPRKNNESYINFLLKNNKEIIEYINANNLDNVDLRILKTVSERTENSNIRRLIQGKL